MAEALQSLQPGMQRLLLSLPAMLQEHVLQEPMGGACGMCGAAVDAAASPRSSRSLPRTVTLL